MAQLAERRRVIADAAGRPRGAGVLERAVAPARCEATAADAVGHRDRRGSGLLVPGLFDHYQSFTPRPAAFFGLPVTRKPSAAMATVHGGGFIASGAGGRATAPRSRGPRLGST